MPRSVSHRFEGPFTDIQLRVWERKSDESLHAIAEGRYLYRCVSGTEHPLEIAARWDVPIGVDPWHSLALRARDRDQSAAQTLVQQMVEEGIDEQWTDPCESG